MYGVGTPRRLDSYGYPGAPAPESRTEYVPSEFFATDMNARVATPGAAARRSAAAAAGFGARGGGAARVPPSPFAGGSRVDAVYAASGIARRRPAADAPGGGVPRAPAPAAAAGAGRGAAPPTASLMDDADISLASGALVEPAAEPFSPGVSGTPTPGRRRTPGPGGSTPGWASPERSSFGTPGLTLPAAEGAGALEGWVTVFGFPPSLLALVLKRFQTIGSVVQHTIGAGNWLHLQYASPLQAQKALSQNGKVLAPNVMLGVVPATEQSLAAIAASGRAASSTPSARYGAAHQVHRTRHYEVDDTDLLLAPRRAGNVCSRVMEYLFSW